MSMERQVGATRIEIEMGDITTYAVDAVVNAANEGLRGGGGVDGAIHRAGGASILEACRRIGHCPTGKAVLTTGGDLPARHVIHTVGPVWQGGTAGEAGALASCYAESLLLARKHGLRTLAFSAISTGVYGYPPAQAARIALAAIRDGVLAAPGAFERIVMVLFNAPVFEAHADAMRTLFPE